MEELVKECLSIVRTSTAKDQEINMWIEAAQDDLTRQGINIDVENDSLIKGAVVMYVKGHFGMCSQNEKDLALKCYNDIVTNLSLSSSYKLPVESED